MAENKTKEKVKTATAPYENADGNIKRVLKEDELTDIIAARILEKHRKAFEELAK